MTPSATSEPRPHPARPLAPALGLFFLAPLVGEFLLGNLPITLLPALVLLAPLYGGGALLIREIARRFGLAWPGIVVLGLTFGVIEEVYTTQSLFNPNYLGLRLLDYGFIPVLGMGAWWTVFVLTLHTIWSTAVPIALMEALTPAARRTPWLGSVGLGVTAVIFVLGCVALAAMEMKKGFIASPAQFAVSGVAVLGLIALGFLAGRSRTTTSAAPAGARRAPAPWLAGLTTLAVGAAFMGIVAFRDRMAPALNVAGMLVLLTAGATTLLAWSRRPGWTERHRLGAAAGFVLVYGAHAFVQVPSVGKVTPFVDRLGDVVFGAGALALLTVAIVKVRRNDPA